MSTLVDTSVWIDHLRRSDPGLTRLLDEGRVVVHPFVIGELSCGALKNRDVVLSLLNRLDAPPVAAHDETLRLVEAHRLWGAGLGWVDIHLLASCLLGGIELWTRDRQLSDAAGKLGIDTGPG